MSYKKQINSPVWKAGTAYLLILPGLLLFMFFFIYPILFSVQLSTTNASFLNFVKGYKSVGVDNFRQLIFRGEFFAPLLRTILFIITSVSLKVFAGLFFASLLSSPLLRLRRIIRPLFLIPWAVPWFLLALIWGGMFNQDFGIIDQIIRSLGFSSINWLYNTWNAFIAYNIVETYVAFPFMMTVTFAAIQSIPTELYEAAAMDGAGPRDLFWRLTLPMIKEPLLWATMMTTIASYMIFGVPYLLNQGGPAGSNEFLLIYGYKNAFALGRYGFASAFMVIVFTILLCLVMVISRVTKLTKEE